MSLSDGRAAGVSLQKKDTEIQDTGRQREMWRHERHSDSETQKRETNRYHQDRDSETVSPRNKQKDRTGACGGKAQQLSHSER